MYDLNTIRQMNERLVQGASSLATKTPEPVYELRMYLGDREAIQTFTEREVQSPRRFDRKYREAVPGAYAAIFSQIMTEVGRDMVRLNTARGTWNGWSLTRVDPPKPRLMNTGPGAHWDTPDEHDGRL